MGISQVPNTSALGFMYLCASTNKATFTFLKKNPDGSKTEDGPIKTGDIVQLFTSKTENGKICGPLIGDALRIPEMSQVPQLPNVEYLEDRRDMAFEVQVIDCQRHDI